MISYDLNWILNAQTWNSLIYILALIPSFAKADAPQNYPSWFIVPQRLAGYPLYLPQQPIFASGGSSDFVSSWGDFRFNNFYDSTGNAEPDKDPLYDHFQEFLAGNWTPPAGTPPPPAAAAAPAEAGDVAADAAADAAEERPAREFADKSKKRRKTNPLAKNRALAESLADELVQTLMKILVAGNVSFATRTSISRNLPNMAAVLLPALSKLAADGGKNITTADANILPSANNTVGTTTTASVVPTEPMPSNLSANPNGFNASANHSIFESSKTEIRTMAPQVTNDLVQLAISWPPVAAQRGMIALPNPIGPRPLEILNDLTDNPFRDFERRSLGPDTGGNSVSNATTFSNKDFANLVRSTVNRTRFAGGLSNRTRVMQKIVVPAYLADFAVVPLLSQANNTNASPNVIEQNSMTYNPKKNTDNEPMDQQTLLANLLSIMRTQKTQDNAPALVTPTPTSPQSQSGVPAQEVQFQQSGDFPFFAEPQPTPKPLFKALRPKTPPITAACMVILGSNRQYLGKCVDNTAIPYECDGMGIKRSQFCPAAASCCFIVSNE